MSTDLQGIKDSIDEEIKGQLQELVDYPNQRYEKLSEIAAGWTFNHSELAKLLDEDNSLAQVDDEGRLPSNPSVWDIIEIAVSEKLDAYAQEEGARQIKEYEEMVEELEGEGFQTSYMPGVRPRLTYIYKDLDKEAQTDAEKEGPHGRSIDPAVPSEQTYEGELFIKGGFKNDYEAWTWLEVNLEAVQAKLDAD